MDYKTCVVTGQVSSDGFNEKFLIYKITNLVNGKIYIGKTTKGVYKRWKIHIVCANTKNDSYKNFGYFQRAIRKYGFENFKVEVLSYANTNEELIELEKYYIKNFNSTNRDIGYNRSPGGDGGSLKKKEKREKLPTVPRKPKYEKKYRVDPNKPKLEINRENIDIFLKSGIDPDMEQLKRFFNEGQEKISSTLKDMYGVGHFISVYKILLENSEYSKSEEFLKNKKVVKKPETCGELNPVFVKITIEDFKKFAETNLDIKGMNLCKFLGISEATIIKKYRIVFGVNTFLEAKPLIQELRDEYKKTRHSSDG